jgi:branched-chain amino acid aminotransferase
LGALRFDEPEASATDKPIRRCRFRLVKTLTRGATYTTGMSQVWINGTLVDKADARVGLFDHGFLYGDAVWEPLRLFHGKPFAAEHHLKILSEAVNALGIDIPLSQTELLAAIDATAKANNRSEGYVRVIVTRGPGTIGPDPRKIEPQVFITAEEYQPFPQELYGHGLHAALVHLPLDLNNPLHRNRVLGQGYYIVESKRRALQAGCLEAIMLTSWNGEDDSGGCCTEGSLFLVSQGEVRWLKDAAPPEATASAVAEIAIAAGYRVVQGPANSNDILAAEEVFIAGTACGVIGIVRIDGTDIANGSEGPITWAIRERFGHLTRGSSA